MNKKLDNNKNIKKNEKIDTRHFFSDLKVDTRSIGSIFSDDTAFQYFPEDWYVVVTDIKNSTRQFLKGKSLELNTIAAASLAIAHSHAHEKGIEIPTVYGGDGATMCIHKSILDVCLQDWKALVYRSEKAFGMNLRVGVLNIHDERLHEEIRVVKVGYHASNPALFDDMGLGAAEALVKRDKRFHLKPKDKEEYVLPKNLSLTWYSEDVDSVFKDIMCLIVVPCVDAPGNNKCAHIDTYREVIDLLTDNYPNIMMLDTLYEARRRAFRSLYTDSVRVMSQLRGVSYIYQYCSQLYETLFTRTAERRERKELPLYLDTIKTDGSLKIILMGDDIDLMAFLEDLNILEKEGRLVFGHRISQSALMTSVIQAGEAYDIALMNTAEGGYTMASMELKKKMGK